MAIKRKEKNDPTGAATPIIKKTRLSATPTALTAALPIYTPTPTPQPFAEVKVPALATRIPTVEVKASKKNPASENLQQTRESSRRWKRVFILVFLFTVWSIQMPQNYMKVSM